MTDAASGYGEWHRVKVGAIFAPLVRRSRVPVALASPSPAAATEAGRSPEEVVDLVLSRVLGSRFQRGAENRPGPISNSDTLCDSGRRRSAGDASFCAVMTPFSLGKIDHLVHSLPRPRRDIAWLADRIFSCHRRIAF